MPVILKLRMLSDEDDCFLRDYEVPYELTLEELHDFICEDLQCRLRRNGIGLFRLPAQDVRKPTLGHPAPDA